MALFAQQTRTSSSVAAKPAKPMQAGQLGWAWFIQLNQALIGSTSGIPGIAMEPYKALYSTVAPYHGSLPI